MVLGKVYTITLLPYLLIKTSQYSDVQVMLMKLNQGLNLIYGEISSSLLVVSQSSQRQRAQIESPKVTSHFGMILNQGTKAPFL